MSRISDAKLTELIEQTKFSSDFVAQLVGYLESERAWTRTLIIDLDNATHNWKTWVKAHERLAEAINQLPTAPPVLTGKPIGDKHANVEEC